MNDELKKLPQDIQAEMGILGSAIVEKEAIGVMTSLLKRDDFYINNHKIIFDAIFTIYQANAEVDFITLSQELDRNKNLEEIGGAKYIQELINSVPTAQNAQYYAKIVREKATLRGLINACDEIKNLSYDSVEEVDKIVGGAEEMIFSVTEERKISEAKLIREYMPDVLSELEYVCEHKGELPPGCLRTPFTKLNNVLSISKGDYVIVAGRPSMGKSSFVLQLLDETVIKNKLPAVLFSLEMGREGIIRRLLCQHSRLDGHKVNRGWIKDGEWVKLTQSSGKFAISDFYIDDAPGLNPYEVRNECRKLKRLRPNLALIVIDYLQLMTLPKPLANATADFTKISGVLKNLARELQVPVITVSQLSRRVEYREDKRPLLSDLRESGAIEQDGDSILMLYRENYYNEQAVGSIAEIIVRKQRNGPTGITTKLFWCAESTRFDNLEKEEK